MRRGGQTREEILKVSMAQNRVDASVNFTAITAELEGFTGSDIKEVRMYAKAPHPASVSVVLLCGWVVDRSRVVAVPMLLLCSARCARCACVS